MINLSLQTSFPHVGEAPHMRPKTQQNGGPRSLYGFSGSARLAERRPCRKCRMLSKDGMAPSCLIAHVRVMSTDNSCSVVLRAWLTRWSTLSATTRDHRVNAAMREFHFQSRCGYVACGTHICVYKYNTWPWPGTCPNYSIHVCSNAQVSASSSI